MKMTISSLLCCSTCTISLYKEDLAQLDKMVAKLKKQGHRRISRSALIRFALDEVDIRDFPRAY